MEEKIVWKGSPSHLVNLGTYLLWLLVFALCVVIWIMVGKTIKGAGPIVFYAAIAATAVPLLIILYKWLLLKSLHYEISTERLKITCGILNKKLNAVELYRVKDYVLDMPFFYRLFSLGSIEIITSDPTNPRLSIRAVRQPKKLFDEIRTHVEACRQQKGVRQLDIDRVDELNPQ